MLQPKRDHPKEKPGLHQRNLHRERYDFGALVLSCPELAPFVRLNPFRDESIDFFDPEAVMMLNKSLLKHFYGIGYWEIPSGYLCPPIPGRADYLHHMADLLASGNHGTIPIGKSISCLDIGTGANCIYPILGNSSYGWSFVGTDIDAAALGNASDIIAKNPHLADAVELRMQKNAANIFRGIMKPDEHFNLSVCNPPFHDSLAEAQSGSRRKVSHLKGKKISNPVLNFGGHNNELWCEGGEEKFITQMIEESSQFSTQCNWFSSLVSKSTHLPGIYHALKMAEAAEVRTISMEQGNKISRIVAWTFRSQI